jgi:hypothetical protein
MTVGSDSDGTEKKDDFLSCREHLFDIYLIRKVQSNAMFFQHRRLCEQTRKETT